jgi:hypothetical protein
MEVGVLDHKGLLIVEAHLLESLVVQQFLVFSEAVDEFAELVFDVVAGGLLGDPVFEGPALLLRVDVVEGLLLVLFDDLVDVLAVSLELELLRIVL